MKAQRNLIILIGILSVTVILLEGSLSGEVLKEKPTEEIVSQTEIQRRVAELLAEMEKVCKEKVCTEESRAATKELMWDPQFSSASSKLLEIGEPALSQLIEAAQDKSKDWRLREELVGILGYHKQFQSSQVTKLIEKIVQNKEESKIIRSLAIDIINHTKNKEMVEPLIKISEDKTEPFIVRSRATFALGRLGDKRAVEPLIKVFKEEKWDLQCGAADSLGLLKDKRAVEPLLIALKSDKDRIVRGYAAVALGRIGDKRAFQPLIDTFNKGEASRKMIIYGLGELGDKRALPLLTKVLKDRDREVRWSAASALGEIGNKDSIPILEETLKEENDSGVRREINFAIKKIKSRKR